MLWSSTLHKWGFFLIAFLKCCPMPTVHIYQREYYLTYYSESASIWMFWYWQEMLQLNLQACPPNIYGIP